MRRRKGTVTTRREDECDRGHRSRRFKEIAKKGEGLQPVMKVTEREHRKT